MKNEKLHYVMVRKSLIITWAITTLTMFVLIGLSFQYTNFVDGRSNGYWCNIVDLFNETYKEAPPSNAAGKILEQEFKQLKKNFGC